MSNLLTIKEPIRFLCYKWGKKYSSIYVNRLYAMVKKNYDGHFFFHCITDNADGIRPEVIIEDLNENNGFRSTKEKVFTVEKLSSFKHGFLNCEGPYVLLDLDILIHSDLTEYLNSCFTELRIIYNYWASHRLIISHYGHSYCPINTSFVTWKGDQANHIYEFYRDNLDKIFRIYWSLDHSLYYLQENKYSFHPPGIVYTYNAGAVWPDDLMIAQYKEDYKICIFNNSHGVGFDVSDAKGWAKEMWCSYDSL